MTALSDPTDRYFGIDYNRSGSTQFDMSIHDLFKARGGGLSKDNWDTTGDMTNSQHFSLMMYLAQKIQRLNLQDVYKAGSRADNKS